MLLSVLQTLQTRKPCRVHWVHPATGLLWLDACRACAPSQLFQSRGGLPHRKLALLIQKADESQSCPQNDGRYAVALTLLTHFKRSAAAWRRDGPSTRSALQEAASGKCTSPMLNPIKQLKTT